MADELAALAAAYLRAGDAFGRADFAAATAAFRDALAINRGEAALEYHIAATLSRSGAPDQAIAALERLTARSALIPQPRDFPQLPAETLARLQARARGNLPPTRSAVAFTLDERDLIPEGIAHDPRTDTLFVGSIYKRKIVAVAADGRVQDFVAPRDDLDAPLGMKVDAARRTLWVAAPAVPSMRGFTESLRNRAAVFAFDLDSGELRARHPRTTPGPHLLNDLVVAGDALYVTDSEAGEVLRLDPATGEYTVVIPAGEVNYANGVALSDDGRTLFVADFVRGLTGVRLDSGERFILAHPRGASTHGFDGLYYRRGALIGVDNGAAQGRIVRLALAPEHDRITAVDVLEAGHPAFDIPTTGTIVGDHLVYIANSQLRSFDGGVIWPHERLQPVQLLRVPLA